MDVELLIRGFIGLVVLLGLLMLLFLLPARKKKAKKEQKISNSTKKSAYTKRERSPEDELSFDALRAIIRTRSSTTEELERAVDAIIRHYIHIPPKLGTRTHPDFDKYVDVIVHLVRHKNTNKDLILKLDKALNKENSAYKAELNDTLSKALNSRG